MITGVPSPRAERAQERQPFAIGQSQIEQDQSVGYRIGRRHRIEDALEPIDRVAGGGDMVAQRLPQNLIVFD